MDYSRVRGNSALLRNQFLRLCQPFVSAAWEPSVVKAKRPNSGFNIARTVGK